MSRENKIKTHTFNKVVYDIDLAGPIDGTCDYPRGGKPSLRICKDISTFGGFETLIHEALHACQFLKTEKSVDRTANDIARFLWRLGYRVK